MAEPDDDQPEDVGRRIAREDRQNRESAAWYRVAGAGFEFAVAVVGFLGLGLVADRWLGTSPWLLLTGLVIGFAGGLWILIRVAGSVFRK